jgi:hypothetical protein
MTNVYLKEGADAEAFRKKIEERYGTSTKDLLKEESQDGTLEERIRAKAEHQMAVLAEEYGVTSSNYAIKIFGAFNLCPFFEPLPKKDTVFKCIEN